MDGMGSFTVFSRGVNSEVNNNGFQLDVVPEPSTYGFLLLGGVGMLVILRRRIA